MTVNQCPKCGTENFSLLDNDSFFRIFKNQTVEEEVMCRNCGHTYNLVRFSVKKKENEEKKW